MKYTANLGLDTWQARDTILVFTAEGGEVSGIGAWLHDYHSPSVPMIRCGTIFAALSIENAGNSNFNRILISPEVRLQL
jgi:hypothetical protein